MKGGRKKGGGGIESGKIKIKFKNPLEEMHSRQTKIVTSSEREKK